MPFDLVADVRCFGGPRARELERELEDPVDALAREDRFLEHDLPLGALEHAPAHRRVFAFGVLAHDDEVDVAGTASCERRRNARHQPAGTQVHVLVEAAAELDQRAPQRDVIRNRGRPADGAVEDRVVRQQQVVPVLGHHPPVLRIVVAVPLEMPPLECDAEPACRPPRARAGLRAPTPCRCRPPESPQSDTCPSMPPCRADILTSRRRRARRRLAESAVRPMARLRDSS